MAPALEHRICVDRAAAPAYDAVLTLRVPGVADGRPFEIECTREDGQIWFKWVNKRSLSQLVRAGYCPERARAPMGGISLRAASVLTFQTVSLCSYP